MAAPSARNIDISTERWSLKEPFVISRGVKTTADVVVVTLQDGQHRGRGEAVPYARYGETIDGVVAALEALRHALPDRKKLAGVLPPGAARNALDCALWDLEAKRTGRSVVDTIGLAKLSERPTAFTLSLDTPEKMAAAARHASQHKCLKLKLGGNGDGQRMAAVRQARPDAELIGDANEAWDATNLEVLLRAAADAGMALIEQPLPAGADSHLANINRLVPVCADESAHTTDDLPDLKGRYDAINIKLDKTGGLTEALRMFSAANSLGFEVMVGCMVATSLAMAPAFLLAQDARWVDLDGPLLLAKDRQHGFKIINGVITPPTPALWG